jgi:hypothetical protein
MMAINYTCKGLIFKFVLINRDSELELQYILGGDIT